MILRLIRSSPAAALLAASLIALAPPANAQSADRAANPRVGPDLANLVYGVYCAQDPERVEPAPETASGSINLVPAIPDFRFRQKIVPAQIGIGFGVLAWAPEGGLIAPVTVTVTHPPYADSGIEVERWLTEIDDGANLVGFSFDTADELLQGQWTFTGTGPDGEELFFVSFEVVPPEMMPQIIDACFDAFVS